MRSQNLTKEALRRPTFDPLPTRLSNRRDLVREAAENLRDSFDEVELNWKTAVSVLALFGLLGTAGLVSAISKRRARKQSLMVAEIETVFEEISPKKASGKINQAKLKRKGTTP